MGKRRKSEYMNAGFVSIDNSDLLDNPKPSNSKEIDQIQQNQMEEDDLFDCKSTTSSEEKEKEEKKANKKRG